MMRSEVSGVRATVARVALSITALSGCYSGLRADGGDDSAGDTTNAGESGDVGDESGTGEPSDELTCDDIGTQPLRRISSSQYEQILRDLLPPAFAEQALAVSVFPRTAIDCWFSTYAAANTVSSTESIQIEDTAERIAEVFYENRVELAPALVQIG